MKHPAGSFVCALAIVLLAATGSALAAPGVGPLRPHMAMAEGLLADPDIPLNCPSASPLQPVSVGAVSSGAGLEARGSMTLDTVELGSCRRITVQARVDCLLVDGSRAFVLGRVQSITPTPRYPISLYAVDLRDNGPAGDKGKLIPLNLPTPASCAQLWPLVYFEFGVWPFTSGGVTIR